MMQTIFDLCEPREDILKGDLREQMFAAHLMDVIAGTADPIYSDAKLFFENTYPTEGLKAMLRECLGRLTGDDAGRNALIRMETSFGGGKTHALIALYHLASGKEPPADTLKWLGEDIRLPKKDQICIAGIVASQLSPTVGILHEEDGIRTQTLWGEIAYLLAGPEGYALARESDELLAAPGTQLLEEIERLHGGKPTLIMIDEIASHLRAGSAYPTKTGASTLADQTVAFLLSLIEYAASRPNAVVVLTLAGEADAFVAETTALAESMAVSARQERVIRPSDEGEMPAIVVHRLFEKVNARGAAQVAKRYSEYYKELMERKADLPVKAVRAEFADEMRSMYPFHPDLLLALDKKVSTIPNFQRTRGALRLLALAVRRLWDEKPEGTSAIHAYHLDLADDKIVEELTSRLERPRFKNVVEADVVSDLPGSRAHSQEIDQDFPLPYARRLSTVIFLHSLSQGIATGLTPAELYLSTLTPTTDGGDDHGVVEKALRRLDASAWFMEYDGQRYRFKTEPSLEKIIQDEKANVGPTKAKAEIDRRIGGIWKKGYLEPVLFPDSPQGVEDDARLPKLAIMHFDTVSMGAADAEPPDIVRRIYRHKGAGDSFRTYQNNLVFLVADKDQVDNMVEVARRHMAIRRILGDAERMSAFSDEDAKKLKKKGDASELEVRVAITRAYRYLFYPAADAPRKNEYLHRETLPPQDQGEVEQDQTNVVIRMLRMLNKVLTADDEVLAAQFVRSKAWDKDQTHMSMEDLRRASARKIGLRMLLDVGQLKRTVHNGVQSKVWVYYNSKEEFAYDDESPPPPYEISEDAFIYDPQEASKKNLRIKGKWKPSGGVEPEPRCPVCGNPQSVCTCGTEPPPGVRRIEGQGDPNKAFQMVADKCSEQGGRPIERLLVRIEGAGAAAGNDLRALALAVPQLGKGIYEMRLRLVLTFGKAPDCETVEINFKAGWDRYKRMRALVDEFTREADEQSVDACLQMEPASPIMADGDDFETIRDVFASLEIDHVKLEAMLTPEEGEGG